MTVNMVQIAFMFFDYDSRAKRYSLVTLIEEYSMKSAPLDRDDPNGLLQRCLNDYTPEKLHKRMTTQQNDYKQNDYKLKNYKTKKNKGEQQ